MIFIFKGGVVHNIPTVPGMNQPMMNQPYPPMGQPGQPMMNQPYPPMGQPGQPMMNQPYPPMGHPNMGGSPYPPM